MQAPRLLMAASLLLACGGESDATSTGTGQPSQGGSAGQAGASGSAGQAGGAGTGGTSAGAGGGAGGALVRIHLIASAAPFAHGDGLAGQTPLSHSSGLRSYRIFKDKSDTAGVVVFDLGKGFKEVSYDDGSDTVVAEVPLTSIPEGVYTRAQVVHTHVRYRVKATAHNAGLAVPGELDNVQVMSDATTVDGVERQSGYYSYTFSAAGVTLPASGNDAPVPTQADTGGFSVKHEGGQWIYEFPVSLTVNHALTNTIDAALRVNMFESFRWKDEEQPGYAPGVFDVTATSFEPVIRFGANSFEVTFGGLKPVVEAPGRQRPQRPATRSGLRGKGPRIFRAARGSR